MQELKKVLQADPYILILFNSASSGLKAIVPISGPKHSESFEALRKYFKNKYNIKIDPKCKDIGRLCFLSHDPDIWINHVAREFVVEYSTVEPLRKPMKAYY
jgi:hypothetical protein